MKSKLFPVRRRFPAISFSLLALSVIFVLFFTVSCGSAKAPDEEILESLGLIPIGGSIEVPEITFTDLDGKTHRLSDFTGSVVMLNFWASWCPPCRAEMPSMSKLNKEIEKGDFRMIAVNVGEPRSLVESFVEEFDIDFPVYLDVETEAAAAFGVSALPTTILLGRNGEAVAVVRGSLEWDEEKIIDMMREWTR